MVDISEINREFERMGRKVSDAMRGAGIPERMRACSAINDTKSRNACYKGVMLEFWGSAIGQSLSAEMANLNVYTR